MYAESTWNEEMEITDTRDGRKQIPSGVDL
jgi:hypothetical protein